MQLDTFRLISGRVTIDKTPEAVLDYTASWVIWLAGDTIASASVTVSGVDLDSSTSDSTTVTMWISGGVVNTVGYADVTITTVGGRVDTRRLHFNITRR